MIFFVPLVGFFDHSSLSTRRESWLLALVPVITSAAWCQLYSTLRYGCDEPELTEFLTLLSYRSKRGHRLAGSETQQLLDCIRSPGRHIEVPVHKGENKVSPVSPRTVPVKEGWRYRFLGEPSRNRAEDEIEKLCDRDLGFASVSQFLGIELRAKKI